MKETIMAIWKVSPFYSKLLFILITLLSLIMGLISIGMSQIQFFISIIGIFFIYYLFNVLNLDGLLDRVTRKQIHTNNLIQICIFLLTSTIWFYLFFSNNQSFDGWGAVVVPLIGTLIISIAYLGSIILLLIINIAIQIKKSRKYKTDFFKKYKIQLIVLIILIIIIIVSLFSVVIYKAIELNQRQEDTELAKKAVKEKNPNLCIQAHDSTLCYYKYARGSMDSSVCKREFVKDRISACNQIGKYGTNWGDNYTYS